LQEDQAALNELGVQHIEHWPFDEAPYRRNSNGDPLYASYAELRGTLAPEDQPLFASIFSKVVEWLNNNKVATTVLYFPLSLGQHVDHQLLLHIGVRLQALGYCVHFYEEWPYVQSYMISESARGWVSQRYTISIDAKIHAASKYTSQIRGLGGSREVLATRLRQSAKATGGGRAQERYWLASLQVITQLAATMTPSTQPFVLAEQLPALRDFKKFAQTLRWRDLAEILPVGAGYCVDIGCGNGRHRDLIQQRGYQWIGLDIRPSMANQLVMKADIQRLPYQSGHAAAVVAWQVLEYAEQPQEVITEVARVLEPGGVFCGSISFLEPMHGRNFYNISHMALDVLLRENGFVDIQIQPGLCGFALMLWTFLRRWGGTTLGQVAFGLTIVWLIPMMFIRFLVSWLWWQLGLGTGHGMQWVTEAAPLEFAGQVVFVARKPARSCTCISDL
jgi:SAM-dependent methyltransferase